MTPTCTTCGQPHPGCTAHTKNGPNAGHPCKKPCRPGEVCTSHGGRARQVRTAAARRAEAAQADVALRRGLAAAYGDQVPDVDPGEAMLRAVSWKYAEVTALRVKVAELDDTERVWGTTRVKEGGDDRGTTQEAKPHIWWTMLRSAEEQLVKFAAAARAAGCDERRVRLAEAQGDLVAGVIRRILDDLALTPAQIELVPVVVPQHLRAIALEGAN